ncbi:winged helix-turn-helix transcriptional regulator [Gilliamella sp. Pas-s25]|uniref:winged helix-turn-helix transcriptional regulator n=1 Tax=Gilliamella sp. Pas-s25 TaxID=2687310 RepID=UPI00135DCA44|nr:helix-turn-helix domain-containing protein [Gilliamella sp. Pas-s25]MWP61204.1 transcriptional regulator [Gilliamella sp. Pas-s25]
MQIDEQRPLKRYNNKTYDCPISLSMDLVGGKWKGVIIYYLLSGEKRFSELKTIIPHITDMTLSIQLKKLEEDGLITRRVFGDKPPLKVVYKLTPLGEKLGPILEQLCLWALNI